MLGIPPVTPLTIASAQKAFVGNAQRAAVAANFSQVQLFNPANSTVNLVVDYISYFCDTALFSGSLVIVSSVVALTALSGIPMVNKSLGGPAGSGQIRLDATAGFPVGGILSNLQAIANEKLYYQNTAPIIVPPGTGIVILPGTINNGINANFNYYEQAR